ncbi:MAG: sugar ABC transporter substrate-binding protein [Acidiphilium sp. 37-67-22]|nr:MAG: sugar ABC transporter substrate-binding protein [Acidiphilium sp. 37-67-22]
MRHSIVSALAAATMLAATGTAAADSLVAPKSLAACFVPQTAATPMVTAKAKHGPYKIAFSNSYYGNNWRTEMLNIARAYVKQPAVAKYISKFEIQNAGNNVAQQVAQIRQMILSGYNAIVIVVVAFDNTVTTDKAININEDQAAMGRMWAQFLTKETGGKGKILMVRGLAGTTVDNDQGDGAMAVFKTSAGLTVKQVYGNWDVGVNQKVTADALSTSHDVAGVWGTEGATGALQAFLQVKAKLVPMTSESDNGFMKLAVAHHVPALVIGQSPALAAAAIRAAIAALDGQSLPRTANIPLNPVTTAQMKAGVNYFPKLPNSFVTDIDIPQCGVKIPVGAVVHGS